MKPRHDPHEQLLMAVHTVVSKELQLSTTEGIELATQFSQA
jgi:hypothetical protein